MDGGCDGGLSQLYYGQFYQHVQTENNKNLNNPWTFGCKNYIAFVCVY